MNKYLLPSLCLMALTSPAQADGSALTLPTGTISAAASEADDSISLATPTSAGSRLGLSALETPASTDSLSGDRIRARGDRSIQDAVSRSAGISRTGTPGDGGTSLSARGFTGQSSVMQLYDGNRMGTVTFPVDTWAGVFTIAVFADDPRHDATLHVDQYSGQVLADVRWKDYSNVARATELGVMLHEGKMFGRFNQILVLVVCLMILLGAVSGLIMWWQRRPQGRLGVPPLRHDLPRWKTAMLVIGLLALAFPLVGASLVVVWLLDRLLLSRWNRDPESASSST